MSPNRLQVNSGLYQKLQSTHDHCWMTGASLPSRSGSHSFWCCWLCRCDQSRSSLWCTLAINQEEGTSPGLVPPCGTSI